MEVPQVTNDALYLILVVKLTRLSALRLSGYILFPTLLFTAHLGGGKSTWVTNNSDSFVRLLAYTVAPLVILAGVYSRIR